MNDAPFSAAEWQAVRYCIETDTMAVEVRPWPGDGDQSSIGRDAGDDLVIHYAPDGEPWLWEIEHASQHPDHISAAISELQRRRQDNDGRDPPSATYELFYRAMAGKKQLLCTYDGRIREVCPVILGHSGTEEKALVYQFGGETKSRLPEWKCISLSKVTNVQLRDGPWHIGDRHNQRQTCVKNVDVDVNPASPYNPKRRL